MAELTWGETEYMQYRESKDRFKKVAVSPRVQLFVKCGVKLTAQIE